MPEDSGPREPVKRFAWPIAASASALTVIASLKGYGETLGWKIVTAVSFVICLGWAVWYVSARSAVPSKLEGVGARTQYRYGGRIRFLVLLLPFLVGVVGTVGLVRTASPHYAAELFEGGGPYSPIVVFDSLPKGAEVRIAKIFYGEDDPTLKHADIKDHVLSAGPTPCRVRMDQGQYWVVIERRSQTVGFPLTVTVPVAVRAVFNKRRAYIFHPER